MKLKLGVRTFVEVDLHAHSLANCKLALLARDFATCPPQWGPFRKAATRLQKKIRTVFSLQLQPPHTDFDVALSPTQNTVSFINLLGHS